MQDLNAKSYRVLYGLKAYEPPPPKDVTLFRLEPERLKVFFTPGNEDLAVAYARIEGYKVTNAEGAKQNHSEPVQQEASGIFAYRLILVRCTSCDAVLNDDNVLRHRRDCRAIAKYRETVPEPVIEVSDRLCKKGHPFIAEGKDNRCKTCRRASQRRNNLKRGELERARYAKRVAAKKDMSNDQTP